ncbi:MAG: ABC transporter permease [Clostridia bacterium]|nr:ABC transporter permease [Clostridia bacterium]
MSITQSFMLAVKSLAASKMRAFLTMLGIVIGVAAVIALVSLMNGMSSLIVSSFEDMGMNNIMVSFTPRGGNREIKPEDMQKFCDDREDLYFGMTPTLNIMGATVKQGTVNSNTSSVVGVSELYDEINGKAVEQGTFLTYVDVENRMRNCVIGTYVRDYFFDGDAIGKTIKINGYPFCVTGVLEESAGGEQSSADDTILIPYTVASKIAFTRVSNYTVAAKDNEHVEEAKKELQKYLFNELGDEDMYTIITMQEAANIVDDILGKMSMVLVGIAGISLLVGGIGIMNIMLVSVTERTREIGIRKALGATPWDILSQFVVEAITTSAIGGVVGIFFGVFLARMLGNMVGLRAVISASAILISVSVSAGIGIAFGYFPAKKAAKLNPIDALRYD